MKILWVIRWRYKIIASPVWFLAGSAWRSDIFDMTKWLKTFLVGRRNMFILIIQYRGGYWCPGDASSHGSSRHDNGLFLPRRPNLMTRKVTFSVPYFQCVHMCVCLRATGSYSTESPSCLHGLFNRRINRLHNAITWERHHNNNENSHNNPKYSVSIYWCGSAIH